MLFTSFEFMIFFAVVVLFYFFIPHSFRWVYLLAASFTFYGLYNPVYLPLLAAPALVCYGAAIRMTAASSPRGRKLWLWAGVGFCLLELFTFKYLDLFVEPFARLTGFLSPDAVYQPLLVLFPIGLSFYLFKSVSYLVDVYWEKLPAERNVGYVALYVAFFPQLLAGPIERAVSFLPELKKEVRFDLQRILDGLKIVTLGFFKKLVIADRLASTVSAVFNNVETRNGPEIVLAVVFYSIQVYCDFSAYSDIAVGLSRVLGFKSMENFDAPYFSTSIVQFWSRWHISLSRFLRDYLFLPFSFAVMRRIKGEKALKVKAETWAYISGISVTMVLGGLWHGAAWTMAFWGLLHGFFLAASFLTRKLRKKWIKFSGLKRAPLLHRFLQTGLTFGMVSGAWILFRAASVEEVMKVISRLPRGMGDWTGKVLGGLIFDLNAAPLAQFLRGVGIRPYDFWVIVFSLGILAVIDFRGSAGELWDRLKSRPVWLRMTVYFALIMSVLLFASLDGGAFVYFRF